MNTNEATIRALGSDLQNDLKVHEGEIRKSRIAEAVDFLELSDAIERNKTGHAPGKTIVNFVR